MARSVIARCGRALGLLTLLLAFAGCAGAGGGGGSGGTGGSGQCEVGSWCDHLDEDQDNLISPQEWDDAFNAMDTGGNGQVSQSEFEAAGGNWGGGGRGR